MKLIRRYRLHGFFLGMFVFIGLWAWRSATSLAPGDESVERGLIGDRGTVAGEQTGIGFIRLLQRSIPGKKLISQCVEVWNKSQVSKVSPEQENQIDSIVRSHRNNPRENPVAETYRAISQVLRKTMNQRIYSGRVAGIVN